MIIGVDIGGTFTDLVLNDNGQLRIHKLLTTPADQSVAMLDGLRHLSGNLAAVKHVIHGSTIATNAILERKGAACALITTQGFRDILFIGRQERPQLYALHPSLPPPLIPRQRCFEVAERLDPSGEVLTPLDLDSLDSIIDRLIAQAVESVAACLLYSFANPTHEQRIRKRLLERGFAQDQIALSSDVLPEFREYERASTLALEAYVRPRVANYLARLSTALPSSTKLRVMRSDGGSISASRARERAILMALSGPAAGVVGASHLARLAGCEKIITLDIGGTSTDVALCDGTPGMRAESAIDGLPLRMRLLDIETIGAGGGSLARLDNGGVLRVGPESAGAHPGPVAYGRGGTQPTVSDANIVLGRIDPDHFLDGTFQLDVPAARTALDALGQQMGCSPLAAALGILNVTHANIDRALRQVSIARGHDPRDFTLVAFGGAGPLHACAVADGLGIRRILIPRFPGVLCALGLLVADVTLENSRAVLAPLNDETITHASELAAELELAARADLMAEGISLEQQTLAVSLDMRYAGQAYELNIPMPASAKTDEIARAFHAAHKSTYGHDFHDRLIEIISLRLRAIGITDKPQFIPEPPTSCTPQPILLKPITHSDGTYPTPIYERETLLPGMTLVSPSLIVQFDSTAYIPPNWTGRVDGYRNIILENNH